MSKASGRIAFRPGIHHFSGYTRCALRTNESVGGAERTVAFGIKCVVMMIKGAARVRVGVVWEGSSLRGRARRSRKGWLSLCAGQVARVSVLSKGAWASGANRAQGRTSSTRARARGASLVPADRASIGRAWSGKGIGRGIGQRS